MKRRNIYKGVSKTVRRLAASCLLLFFLAGNALAQNDSPFVIKKDDNYLAHRKDGGNYVLENAGSFNPATCLWYSGPTHNPTGYTHNYYFEDDEGELRFLAAPLTPNSTLSLSSSLPSVSLLRNTDQVYYFYNWDPETSLSGVPEGGGVAKGHRYYVNSQAECATCGEYDGASWHEPETGSPQCWEVYWIEYKDSQWKLSSASSYGITEYAARYRKVTITEHEKEVTDGGLTTLTAPTEMNFEGNSELSASVESPYSYIPAYTNYVFLESGSTSVHNYWDGGDHSAIPEQQNDVDIVSESISYQWTISGDGAEYLSFVNSSSNPETTSTLSSPILYYVIENNTGHKTATITVTVTYTDEYGKQTTQTRSATVLVKTPCQNPIQAAPPVITYVGVTVSWVATADSYTIYWKKDDSSTEWSSATVNGATSYTITGLEYNTRYVYKVTTDCGTNIPTEYRFTTKEEPGLMVVGAIFGGGRMANVGGKTEVIIVNCDSIGGIYGGNDIAGEVEGADGSTIMLGVNSGDPTYGSYGTTGDTIRFGSVYGGGNGYYAYNGTSFVAAAWDTYESQSVAAGASVMAMTQNHTVGDAVWTNTSGAPKTLDFPSIVKTAITVSNDYVKADSIFGGAKNAFLTAGTGNGSTITINGGTIMAVFGGNNFGGGQGYGIHYIEVNGTKTKLALDIQNSATKGYGRTFGIRDLFGGGNKVYGSTTDIKIYGGQIDNVFGGGNSADVYQAKVTVNCSLDAYSSNYTFGNTYTNAIPTSYSSGAISIKDDYAWDGKGIYNVRNLYGGNNMEAMAGVPSVTLTSGSVGTVYGGGNAGDMLAQANGSFYEDSNNEHEVSFQYSTSVTLNSANMIVDYLYGGCRMSNVDYSTWVEIQNGHVGTAFGGCNVSGDVGSTRTKPSAATETEDYQAVQGGTYVHAKGGTVYKNLFAGGNGFYHCNENFRYVNVNNISYTNEYHVGKLLPTHNETHVYVSPGATVKGNVYAGGNLAPVGFPDGVASEFPSFPTNTVGWALVHVYGGTVLGNVYGGGNMADIYGNNNVMVAGGTIAAVYGGNDRTGSVAGEYSNRVLPPEYYFATDGNTSLINPEVHAYVRITGNPTIQEVYGGGNGDYDYEHGDEVVYKYCNENEEGPIQSNTFVDININGGSSGGYIGTVYGGGDGVTATGFITVLMNIVEPVSPEDHDNVGVVFGGNNKGDLELLDEVPDIILLHGQVGTVYGGCNEGAMNGSAIIRSTDNANTYSNVGSLVRLRRRYITADDIAYPTAKVSKAIYGGCRMNGVAHNSLVLVEGGNFYNVPIFGGSDISGTVGEWSKVVVRDDAAAGSGNGVAPIVGNLYGGGNGNYDYESDGNVYKPGSDHTIPANLVATGITEAPICANSGADILGGSVGTEAMLAAHNVSQVFGGGYGKDTKTTGDVTVNVGSKVPTMSGDDPILPVIYGDIYGGSAFGDVNTDDISGGTVTTSTTVNLFNGTLHSVTETVGGFEVYHGGNVYGGGLGRKAATGVTAIAAKVYGKVFVNVSSQDQDPDDCYLNLREANIFGCNNANGSPQDDVEVHVWRTADTINEYNSQSGSLYAIRQVFGGGNQADYTPTGKKTLVYVHDCRNTIKRVFSGGNAAAATGVSAIIEGGRFDYIFGGGNGEVSAANIGAGGTDLTVSAGIINHLFGGSNLQGEITGPVNTDVNGDNMGSACAETINEFFGGSNEAGLEANVYTLIECGSGLIGDMYGGSNKANITGNVRLDVRGGSFTNVYGGSKGVLNGTAANITGNVTLNLEGGTIVNAYGGNNQNGNITGKITVNVIDYELEDCELDLTNVYGGGNLASYSPTNYAQDGPIVNVMHIKQAGTQQVQGVKGNVFGGGNQAQVNAHTKVNIGYNATTMSDYLPDDLNTASNQPNTANFHAYVTGNVYGGGNEAGIGYKDEQEQLHGGNTYINVYNGEVCQHIASGEQSVGIYGGCNTTGTVLGNSRVTLLGGTVGNSTTRANIHGGGFGSATLVEGNVTVTFGEVIYDNSGASPVEVHTDEPILYGDLYGGSALGHVNHNNTQTTTVHILNGEITGVPDPGDIQAQYGNVFGGGLGNADHAALVKGRVYVYIGACDTPPSSDLSGQAKLDKCNVFGCNNKNGSPQDDVEVHVYKTYQIAGTNTFNDDDYAVLRTFGGGNESNYAPENNNPNSQKKTHVYVHSCDNTIKYVYGGSNAAAAVGVETLIEGGRFREIYGGGNGTSIPANIGLGGIGINVNGGYASYYFEGCNHLGTIAGLINQPRPSFPEGYTVCSGSLVIDSYYFGDNEAEHFGDLVGEITCDQASHFNFKNVFAGSRWAIVYGDIKLTVKGGNIEYLFGGSQGYIEDNYPADVRRFPSLEEIEDMNELHPGYYSQKLIDTVTHNPSLIGTGGNILLIVQGGTIGDVIGGCQELGNVEGKITVIIDALDDTDCPLVIGNVYGASLQTDYEPIDDDTHHAYFEPGTANAVPTPQVKILKGTVGSDSPVTFNVTGNVHQMEGNVYGGGDIGNVTANPKVIIGNSSNSPVEIKGNVYGGGKDGSVDGSPEVIIVPIKHTLTITQPDATDGVIRVTDRQGNTINSGATIDEYQDLNLVAIPSAYGKKLDKWVVTNGSVLFEKSVNTMFTMGTTNASITATFTSVDTYSLTVTHQGEGSVAVTDAQGNGWTSDDIGVGAVLNIVATPTPNSGYTFLRWEVVGTGSTVANANAATTTFTMGTANTTLKAVFVPTHQLTIATPEHGTITVTDIHGQTVTSGAYIGEGALLNIVAHPANTYEFTSWTVTNGTVTDATAISTTFVMGTASGDASISATFHEQPNP